MSGEAVSGVQANNTWQAATGLCMKQLSSITRIPAACFSNISANTSNQRRLCDFGFVHRAGPNIPIMSSPLCTNCSSVFKKLLHIETGRFTHRNVLPSPDSCQFCARLWTTYQDASSDTSSPVSVYYSFKPMTPDSGELCVEILSDNISREFFSNISREFFSIVPSAGRMFQRTLTSNIKLTPCAPQILDCV